jgi:hypothetical protein
VIDLLDGLFAFGFMPPFRESGPRRELADAIRVPESEHREGVQLGPVHYSAGRALYDCPCGCKLWTSEPAKLCGRCETLRPATHWDTLVDCCGDCAGEAYGE